jgi:hypothetical protein
VDAQRAERIHDNLRRLGLSAQVVVADAARPQTGGNRPAAAPCSTPSCSTRPARHRASCAAIPTCAGCAASDVALAGQQARCWRAVAAAAPRWAHAVLHLLGVPCRGRRADLGVSCAQHRCAFAAISGAFIPGQPGYAPRAPGQWAG